MAALPPAVTMTCSIRALGRERAGVTFGQGGTVVTASNDAQVDVLGVGPDGKIVVAGWSASSQKVTVARYLGDGTPDSTFGTSGVAVTSALVGGVAQDLVVLADGNILILASMPYPASGLFLLRIAADGSPDASFGTNGTVTIDTPSVSPYRHDAVSLLSTGDGKYLAGDRVVAIPYQAFVYRLLSDGTLDASFGNAGVLSVQPYNLYSVAPGPGTSFTLAGASYGAPSFERFSSDGSADATFVHGTLPFSMASGHTAAVDGLGMLLVTFQSSTNVTSVARLTQAGQLDPTFGADGIAAISSPAERRASMPSSIAVQGDGKIAVVGSAYAGLGASYVTRILVDGTLDTSFGVDGLMTTDFGVGHLPFDCDSAGRAVAMALQNGKWIVAGRYGCNGSYFALARYVL